MRVVPVEGLREEQGVEEQGGGVQGGGRGRGRGGGARGRGRARSNGGVAGVGLFAKITWIYICAITLNFVEPSWLKTLSVTKNKLSS